MIAQPPKLVIHSSAPIRLPKELAVPIEPEGTLIPPYFND